MSTPVAAKTQATPTKRVLGLFMDDLNTDELQMQSPRHSMSEPDIAENVKTRVRRSRRAPDTMQPPPVWTLVFPV